MRTDHELHYFHYNGVALAEVSPRYKSGMEFCWRSNAISNRLVSGCLDCPDGDPHAFQENSMILEEPPHLL